MSPHSSAQKRVLATAFDLSSFGGRRHWRSGHRAAPSPVLRRLLSSFSSASWAVAAARVASHFGAGDGYPTIALFSLALLVRFSFFFFQRIRPSFFLLGLTRALIVIITAVLSYS